MAGAGYKLFNTGDVLTAAQVNTYLMEQTVMAFADAAARTSALSGVLAEGMVSYLKDTNTLEVYDGSAWVGATGDITGLTAGTGISISSATGPVPTITNDVATEFDAKGDLVVGTGADTFDKLSVGNDGEIIVANSSASVGLSWQGNFAAGKNKIINGDFGIWQRGTTFTNPGNLVYTADRFTLDYGGATGGTVAWSQQTFTPGTAPVAGYEGQYFARYNMSVASTGQSYNNPFEQRIEDVRTLAGQTVTFSAWVKSDSSRNFSLQLYQNFGSGGSTQTVAGVSSTFTATTSWQRFTFTTTMPSVSGKTIGAGSHVKAILGAAANNTVQTIDTWGWQLEAGNVATAFQTATGTLAGELAACQRYYTRLANVGSATEYWFGSGYAGTTTQAQCILPLTSTMRSSTITLDYSGVRLQDYGAGYAISALIYVSSARNNIVVGATSSGLTANRPLAIDTNTTGYIGISAEL